ncbi:MAG: ABC-type transport auxiliary lipoprotein family protein [Desulfobacterales bacterium]
MKKQSALLIVSAVILTVSGCSSLQQPVRKIDYYTLEYQPTSAGSPSPLPVSIQIDRFQVSPAYDANRMIYSEEPFKRDAYVYHKWRANPGDLVTYFLARDLRKSSRFASVFSLKSRLTASHILEGAVDEFYEHDGDDAWHAVLALDITLIKNKEPDISKRVIFQKQYRETQRCAQKHPRALAEAMSKAMGIISGKITNDIAHHLADTP